MAWDSDRRVYFPLEESLQRIWGLCVNEGDWGFCCVQGRRHVPFGHAVRQYHAKWVFYFTVLRRV